MQGTVGVRREDIDDAERRAPFTPVHVKKLINKHGLQVIIEKSNNRIFSDDMFSRAGAMIADELSDCNVIFGVKEIPIHRLLSQQAYCFFSHTIKGQFHNMPMLKRMLDLRNTLIDYEKVTDRRGKRLIYFSRYAGYAGMINTLWALGLRLKWENLKTPFSDILQTFRYNSLEEAREKIRELGQKITQMGIPENMVPFICGFTGYGQVSQAAQEIFDLLPHAEIPPSQLKTFMEQGDFSNQMVYKVIFRESDMFAPMNSGKEFHLKEYYNHPELYRSIFEEYIPYLTILINGIYWEPKYPRLVTKHYLYKLFQEKENISLRIIGDISCDVNGSIECNVTATNFLNPIYVYNPLKDDIIYGHEGRGIIILAVDKLPSELPAESTQSFGDALLSFVPSLAKVNFKQPLNDLNLPEEFQKAVIAHNGKLSPDYKYLLNYLK